MKFLLLFMLCLLSFNVLMAQDVIVTNDNKFLEVEIVKSESSITFYREEGSEDIKFLSHDDIKLIQRKSKSDNAYYQSVLGSQGFYLEKKNETMYKKAGIASAIFGSLALVNLGTSFSSTTSEQSVSEAFLGFLLLGGTVILGVVALIKKGKPRYKLRQIDDLGFNSPTDEVTNLDQKKKRKQSFISASRKGVGLQLNF